RTDDRAERRTRITRERSAVLHNVEHVASVLRVGGNNSRRQRKRKKGNTRQDATEHRSGGKIDFHLNNYLLSGVPRIGIERGNESPSFFGTMRRHGESEPGRHHCDAGGMATRRCCRTRSTDGASLPIASADREAAPGAKGT